MKNKILFLIILLTITIIYSCKKEINSPDSSSIEFNSFKSNGCSSISTDNDLEKVVDYAQIETNYENGKLEVNINFWTHCSANMKDSIVVDNQKIDIYLKDISTSGSKCICSQDEEFEFIISGKKEVEIKFNYDPYAAEGYTTLADTIIQLY